MAALSSQAGLAQSVERQALNLMVGGSSPPVGAQYFAFQGIESVASVSRFGKGSFLISKQYQKIIRLIIQVDIMGALICLQSRVRISYIVREYPKLFLSLRKPTKWAVGAKSYGFKILTLRSGCSVEPKDFTALAHRTVLSGSRLLRKARIQREKYLSVTERSKVISFCWGKFCARSTCQLPQHGLVVCCVAMCVESFRVMMTVL